MIRWFLLPLLLATSALGATPSSRIRRPVDVVRSPSGSHVLVANRRSGSVSAIDRRSRRVITEIDIGGRLSALARVPGRDWVLATDEAGGELIAIGCSERFDVSWRVPVSGYPVSVAASADGHRAVVGSLWSRRLTLVDWTADGVGRRVRTLDLPFAPGHLLELPDGRWLVAATFGGRMAICDSHLQRPALIRSLLGHNIGRMSLTADRRGVLIPHQLLDSKAETTRGGVHWGGVMLNVIRTIPIDAITAGSDRLDSRLGLDYVGIPDRAAGDPVSITLARDNLRVVLLSGVHELVTSTDGIQYYGRQAVGLGPSSLSLDDDGTRAWVTGRFADTVSLVQLAPLEVLATISLGPPAKPTSIDRGEQLFNDSRLSSDGWISCRSCHTRGHTNGGLSDTLGDGGFGAPKKVLSLLGSGATGPWAWNGEIKTLAEQVAKSVKLTMRGETIDPRNAEDIAAYLKSLPTAPSVARARGTHDVQAVARGRVVFQRAGCAGCHSPPSYTSSRTYDVGISDELGRRRFNPPSLRGVSQRDGLFHDNRARDLGEVIGRFGHGLKTPLDADDRAVLLQFLESL
ncbi:MAG: cytochrome c peroxidase [Planctomycetota bacterium]|nr:cytochrome c peroxidase [Planctomycetota bacterium]